MRLLRILLIMLTLATCGGVYGCEAVDEPSAPVEKPRTSAPVKGTIVCVGNSLTEGLGVDEEKAYPALLKQRLDADGHFFRVVNAGISGETSSGTLSRIRWILTLSPDIVILETGANDGLRGLDPKLIQENITNIVQALQADGVIVILAGMEMMRNLGTAYTTAFRNIYPHIAEEEKVIFVPFFLAGVAGNPRLNRKDGIHPTTEGYQVVTETIYPYVLEAIEIFERM